MYAVRKNSKVRRRGPSSPSSPSLRKRRNIIFHNNNRATIRNRYLFIAVRVASGEPGERGRCLLSGPGRADQSVDRRGMVMARRGAPEPGSGSLVLFQTAAAPRPAAPRRTLGRCGRAHADPRTAKEPDARWVGLRWLCGCDGFWVLGGCTENLICNWVLDLLPVLIGHISLVVKFTYWNKCKPFWYI